MVYNVSWLYALVDWFLNIAVKLVKRSDNEKKSSNLSKFEKLGQPPNK